MKRKTKKGIKATKIDTFQTKSEKLDGSYRFKHVAIDFTFDYLFSLTSYNQFTNKFLNHIHFIEYIYKFHTKILSKLTKMTFNNVVASNGDERYRHIHTIGEDTFDLICRIIHSSILTDNNFDNAYASSFIEQNIKDVEIWQIGFDNSLGRVYGYFKENIFTPILLDPHHLVCPDKNGHKGRFNDVKKCLFEPRNATEYTHDIRCVHCHSINNLNNKIYDELLREYIYICDECLLSLLDK